MSDLLNKELDGLLLTFFNICQESNIMSVRGSFKKSKKNTITEYNKKALFVDVSENLKKYYNLPFYFDEKQYRFDIINDLELSFDQFIEKLRNIIILKITQLPNLENLDKKIALAIIILRGTIDDAGNFMTTDILRKNQSEIYLDSFFRIISISNELCKYLNWNFRELQPGYASKSSKKNTQLRINLRWVFENNISEMKQINRYKYDTLLSIQKNIKNLPEDEKMYKIFIERLLFYRKNIIGHELDEKDFVVMRNELFNEKNTTKQRRKQIMLFVKNTTDDNCSACKDSYNIKDRSFIIQKENRYYFEYHHVISFSNNPENLDVPNNLVKLCPACHRAMTPDVLN